MPLKLPKSALALRSITLFMVNHEMITISFVHKRQYGYLSDLSILEKEQYQEPTITKYQTTAGYMFDKTNQIIRFQFIGQTKLTKVSVTNGQTPGKLQGHQFYTIGARLFIFGGMIKDNYE